MITGVAGGNADTEARGAVGTREHGGGSIAVRTAVDVSPRGRMFALFVSPSRLRSPSAEARSSAALASAVSASCEDALFGSSPRLMKPR